MEFQESFMSAGDPLEGSSVPGFGAGNRTPDTSRVHNWRARSGRAATKKGLARSAVSVVREGKGYTIRVKGTRVPVGLVVKVGRGNYSLGMLAGPQIGTQWSSFDTQGEAVGFALEMV